MVKLRTPKASGALRKLCNLRPVLRCKTRWSGAFNMVERYFELKDYVKTLAELENDPHGLEELQLRPSAVNHLKILFTNMEKLNSVMLELQKPEVDLSTVRFLFDATIQLFPSMKSFIAADAKIVHSPNFENALVKLQQKVLFHLLYLISLLYLLYLLKGTFDRRRRRSFDFADR